MPTSPSRSRAVHWMELGSCLLAVEKPPWKSPELGRMLLLLIFTAHVAGGWRRRGSVVPIARPHIGRKARAVVRSQHTQRGPRWPRPPTHANALTSRARVSDTVTTRRHATDVRQPGACVESPWGCGQSDQEPRRSIDNQELSIQIHHGAVRFHGHFIDMEPPIGRGIIPTCSTAINRGLVG